MVCYCVRACVYSGEKVENKRVEGGGSCLKSGTDGSVLELSQYWGRE